jgi:hypothetical protein
VESDYAAASVVTFPIHIDGLFHQSFHWVDFRWLFRLSILHLAAELNFYRLFNEAIESFAVEDVAARQSAALTKVGL